jgi:methylmalonyl-CoA decarboxylase
MIAEVTEIFEGLEGADEYYVVIITGAGEKAFSSGFDLTVDRKNRTDEQAQAWPKMCNTIEEYEYPTIAMLNGLTYGGAMNIAASCDFRICVDDVTFGITPAKLGLVYGGDGIGRIYRLIGSTDTKKILFTADSFSAEEAYEMGFVDDVINRNKLESHTYEWAETMAGNAPLSLIRMKEIVNMLDEKCELTEQEHQRVEEFREKSFKSRDYQEGIDAFHEGREPEFEGR